MRQDLDACGYGNRQKHSHNPRHRRSYEDYDDDRRRAQIGLATLNPWRQKTDFNQLHTDVDGTGPQSHG